MAHIPDGVLSAPVLVTGTLVSTGLLAIALRQLREAELPQAAVLAAAFFVSSLISVPLGPSSVHLLLNGLMGLLLGWAALPAIFVALLLQAVFFGFGGLLVLGVNTMNLALPALVVALLLRPALRRVLSSMPSADLGGSADDGASPCSFESEVVSGAGSEVGSEIGSPRQRHQAFVIGLGAGMLGVVLTAVMLSGSLLASGEPFGPAARVIAITFVPLALIEGLLTGIVVAFLLRVEPALLRLDEVRRGS
ncbi:CbiM family transporter [Halochromatium sp.]